MIMPPVMGAGAFVMAALLGVPFNTIMVASVLPALLYYGTVLLMVHLTALRDGLKGLPADELPSIRSVLKKLYMMSPIVLLVYMLLAGYTPMYGAIAGISLAWAVSLLNPGKRMGPKQILQAIHDGSENIPLICTACASAGLVIGSVALSGIGFKFVSAVLALSGGIPFLALILIVASLSACAPAATEAPTSAPAATDPARSSSSFSQNRALEAPIVRVPSENTGDRSWGLRPSR